MFIVAYENMIKEWNLNHEMVYILLHALKEK